MFLALMLMNQEHCVSVLKIIQISLKMFGSSELFKD